MKRAYPIVTTLCVLSLLHGGASRPMQSPQHKNPVFLIPGIVGSRLDVRLSEEYQSPHWYCMKGSKQPKWQNVWLKVTDYLTADCINDVLHVFVNKNESSADENAQLIYSNRPGVEVRATDFGGLSGISSLDPLFSKLTAYLAPVINLLEANGWKAGETLFGAPYDFRFAGDGLLQFGFHRALADLIEQAVSLNEQPAVLVAHSMGGLVLMHFMGEMSSDWLKKHVAAVVTISTPYGGSPFALLGSVSGNAIGVPSFLHDIFIDIQDNSPSGPWLFPAQGVWPKDYPFILTRSKNYTGSEEDYMALLQDLGRTDQALALPVVRNLQNTKWNAPNGPDYHESPVPFYCLHGVGLLTSAQFSYDVDKFNKGDKPNPPKVTAYADGDSIVDTYSSSYCKNIPGLTMTKAFKGQEHIKILSHPPVQELLLEILANATIVT